MKHNESFQALVEFLTSKSGLRMSHIYKPVMLLGVIRRGGRASKQDIAEDFALSDHQQVDYYRTKVVQPMPGKRLVRDGLLRKLGNDYFLDGLMSELTGEQMSVVCNALEERITDYLDMRYPFGDSNNDAVRGSVRYEVLRRAGGRCELCGVTSRDMQIDVDHVVPRAKGGTNDADNLQALCRTCNAQKRDRDDTNFRLLHEAYTHREDGCIFCHLEEAKIVSGNRLALVVRDAFPVTPMHTLIIPRRHVDDYGSATQAEVTAMNRLAVEQREFIRSEDDTVTGFNIGVNCGVDAGQTIFHAHMHLIPRRAGDVSEPRGGVRNTIPGEGAY